MKSTKAMYKMASRGVSKMQPDLKAGATVRRIVQKEVTLFFAAPVAYLFLASFAAISLFVFFWGESFFARNIADVRPLFEWMPVLLIFLSATLTMKMWSEERKSGTLEYVFTQPVPLWHFVLGKFIACLLLLLAALAMTLPLPLTVALIGDLDWGPVLSGYIATLLLGAAYLSMGLFASARSDNQIVSLILASAIGGAFYLIGTPVITDLFAHPTSDSLRALATGARFDSITRGVLDIRDLYYYLSIVLAFLALNTFVLEKERWIKGAVDSHHNQWRWVTALVVINALIANLWLSQLSFLRADMTEGRQYSISDATHNYLDQLQEPLLIRGYFSSKTHPLLAPLVPQMRDLITEYEVAGKGRVRVEFVDPASDPEKEEEANKEYGIQAVPFQVADRYQASIVSSYFNVLLKYGDEYQVLSFRDLIEVQSRGEGDLDVQLRNPEHDLTRGIKKVLASYQAGGNLFDTVKKDLLFTAYVSADNALPPELLEFKTQMQKVVQEIADESRGRLQLEILDPDANGGQLGQQIAEEFGFQPMATSLFSEESFYFYLTLRSGEQIIQLPLGDFTEQQFQRDLEAGIKRFASGFTKTVAVVAPQQNASPYNPYQQQPTGPRFAQLEAFLGAELNTVQEDLRDGSVAGEADLLLLLAPDALDEKAVFAVDQFLMKGGTVILASSPYTASFSNRGLNAEEKSSGLEAWLEHHGLMMEKSLVMDTQNSAFPIPVTRSIGGFQFQEISLLDYPYFVDVRGEQLNQDNLITSELPQVTMSWASPIKVDADKQGERKVTELIRSSQESWLSDSLDIMPQVGDDGGTAMTPFGEQQSQLLGVVSEGRFDSFFAGKASPLLEETEAPLDSEAEATVEGDGAAEDSPLQLGSVIERSSESARIILFSSNDFLRDQVISMAAGAQQSEYLNTLQMTNNAIDWSLEDSGLLSIRSRGHFNRTLPPMERDEQVIWEYINYGLAVLFLGVIAFIERRRRNAKQKHYAQWLAGQGVQV